MHALVAALFVLPGLGCLGYVLAAESTMEREPPLLALGVLLVTIGAGLAMRARAAHVLAYACLVGSVVVNVVAISGPHVVPGVSDPADEQLVARFHLFAYALAIGGVVVLGLLLRRAHPAAAFGRLDLVPVGGLVLALVLGLAWLAADDARLRPCRNGNEEACRRLATTLLEGAERAPFAAPTPPEVRAARVLEAHRCGADDRWTCALQRYALGTVEARARRLDAAKESFRWACAADRSWCARAAREPLPGWTPDELAQLSR
jgi:hypothetical protein